MNLFSAKQKPTAYGSGHVQMALPVGVMPLENTQRVRSNGENLRVSQK